MQRGRVYLAILAILASHHINAQDEDWAPREGCHLNPSHPMGLYPDAATKLADLGLSPRITRALDTKKEAKNVHSPDKFINGIPYTGAVDLSILCFAKGSQERKIKEMLVILAENGFVAWYRKNGLDSWNGDEHIHAVWVKQPLKPVLNRQVESWLKHKNGLKSNKEYTFWKPTDDLMKKIKDYRTHALP